MRFLKKLTIFLLALIALLIVIGFVLPQNQHVERFTNIDATPEEIYPYLNNPHSFNQWSPWAKIDPDMKIVYTGPESGSGSGMSWSSEHPNVGNGSWVITNIVEGESVDMKMDFGEQGGATSSFRLNPEGSTTQLIWSFDTDAGMNPLMRWFGLMMDKWVGSEYEKGLADLKSLIEKP